MPRPILIPALAMLAVLIAACNGSDPVASTNGQVMYADQGYYPTETGSSWDYRIDTASATGTFVTNVSHRHSEITGTAQLDTTQWAVQVTRIVSDSGSTVDTSYVRKGQFGVYLTSTALRNFTLLAQFGITLPKELLVLPYNIWPGLSWDLLNIDYTISVITIKFLVKATYVGIEPVQVGARTFKDCARIRIDLTANIPNPQNLLQPISLKENASFWFSKPFGMVLGDGSSTVFAFLGGSIPLGSTGQRTHMELTDMNVVQPNDPCRGRK